MSEELPSGTPRRLARNFRWQAFFQRCAEPLFVLDRRLRLLFVNHAWETLTGMPATQAHVLVCRRSRPTTADDSTEAGRPFFMHTALGRAGRYRRKESPRGGSLGHAGFFPVSRSSR